MKWAKEILINLHAILISNNDNADFVRNALREITDNEIKLAGLQKLEDAVSKFRYAQMAEWEYNCDDDVQSVYCNKHAQKLIDLVMDAQDELFELHEKSHKPF